MAVVKVAKRDVTAVRGLAVSGQRAAGGPAVRWLVSQARINAPMHARIGVRKAQFQKGPYQKGPYQKGPIPKRPIPERPNTEKAHTRKTQ